MTSTLLVLRHAKAVDGGDMPDAARPLAPRGRADAAAAGDWLRANGLVPGAALCSTAVRTRETLDALAIDTAVDYEPLIYDNDASVLARLVREADAPETLLLVGHNPSVQQLVFDLAGEGPSTYPTCTLAVITFGTGWPDAWPGTGTLKTVRTA
ncbi:phosphohistidine phosphatase [Actinomadura rubteroloni]|uniref:Phosphohistidine phosphatase n=1 Tax=Actinomadura rubteroloni TaxID=1926885 RepID=A0A2P4ULS6_9ACTN|nr:histidine phosphatase family protein [Actinomadura rubteroloni]POM26000.1 phosphohistidine phosphatase [Actinomadura rubteroloni]